MKFWKVKSFARDARKERVSDEAIENAAKEVADGQFEARLSPHVVKKRIPRDGAGKRGGFRSIVAVNNGEGSPVIFLEVYAKNNKSKITKKELTTFEEAAKSLLNATKDQIEALKKKGTLIEMETKDE
jgi:hypothetical protein